MHRAPSVALVTLVAASALPAAHADIYRWVDARGVVNYASTRPEGVRQVEKFTDEASRLSTVPGIPADQLQRERERLLEARVRRLEQEAEDLRRARALALPPPVTYTSPLAYEYPYSVGYGYVYPYYGVPVYRPPRFRPGLHPAPLPRPGGMHAGGGPRSAPMGLRGRVAPR
jgi:hypothetical protein